MKTFFINALLTLILSLLHGWAYWCALIDGTHTYDFKVLHDWLPLLLIVSSIVVSGVALTAIAAFVLQQKFNLSRKNTLISYGLIYILWCFSALMLYYPNNGMDAYSASMGVLFYVPLHVGVFTVSIFLIDLIAALLMRTAKSAI